MLNKHGKLHFFVQIGYKYINISRKYNIERNEIFFCYYYFYFFMNWKKAPPSKAVFWFLIKNEKGKVEYENKRKKD
jgi:hypothetical protein